MTATSGIALSGREISSVPEGISRWQEAGPWLAQDKKIVSGQGLRKQQFFSWRGFEAQLSSTRASPIRHWRLAVTAELA
jgi:hypothetical protein